MKKSLIYLLAIIGMVVVANAQDNNSSIDITDKILSVYSEKVDPYLKNILDEEFSDSKANKQSIESAKYARFEVFKLEKKRINEAVKKGLLKMDVKNRTDKKVIMFLAESRYKNAFVGLPRKFYQETVKAIEKQ
jgi:hypothetical protein